jgi:hypothetical protein
MKVKSLFLTLSLFYNPFFFLKDHLYIKIVFTCFVKFSTY